MSAHDEATIASQEVHRGRLLTMRVDRVRLASGRETTREVVEHPGAVAVVPLLPDGRVILVRQYRYPAGRALLEIPAGTRDQPGEATEVTAARELEEETGYRAEQLIPIAEFFTAPGFCTELMSLYLATGLSVGTQELMEDEVIDVEEVVLADVPALLASGALADAKTILGLLAAREYLNQARA